jgi:hypothetical protein
MFIPKLHKSVGKVCALVATTLILPVLAYADRDDHRGNDRDYRGNDKDYRANDRDYRGNDRDYRGNDRDYRGNDRDYRANDRDYRGNDNNHKVHPVPDGGAGIVLLTTAIGAVLLFGAKQRSRAET